jgi:hypothetical protein
MGKFTVGTVSRWLWPKTMDMIGSLQWKTAGEPYTLYQEMAPPVQAEEEGPPS